MIGSDIKWENKIETADRFYHKGRMQHFVCYHGNDETVYPADRGIQWGTMSAIIFQHPECLTFIKSDCKRLYDIYENYKRLNKFKRLYVNPYFFTI